MMNLEGATVAVGLAKILNSDPSRIINMFVDQCSKKELDTLDKLIQS